MTYQFRIPPMQPGTDDRDECFGLGWKLNRGSVRRCSPCDVSEDDPAAGSAAVKTIAGMYQELDQGQELVLGYGYEPLLLHPLPRVTNECPDCGENLLAVEAGSDRYGSVSIDGKVLRIETEGFSRDGNGPDYLSTAWSADIPIGSPRRSSDRTRIGVP